MPTYNYECSCGHTMELILKMSEMTTPTESPCPSCNQEGTVKKVIVSATAFVRPNDLKGLDSDFKWAMTQMKKRHRRSNIPDY